MPEIKGKSKADSPPPLSWSKLDSPCLVLERGWWLCGNSARIPAWLMSLTIGVALTVIACGAGRLMDIRSTGLLGALLCVSLILIFSTSVWFLFFAS